MAFKDLADMYSRNVYDFSYAQKAVVWLRVHGQYPHLFDQNQRCFLQNKSVASAAGRRLHSAGSLLTTIFTIFAGFTLRTTSLSPLTTSLSHTRTWPLATNWPVIRNVATRPEMTVLEVGGTKSKEEMCTFHFAGLDFLCAKYVT